MPGPVKPISFILVTVQFVTLFAMIFSSEHFLCQTYITLGLQILGVLLGFSALFYLNEHNLNVLPDTRKNGYLIKSGPYKFIRHPMYLSLFLIMIAYLTDTFLVYNFNYVSLGIFIVFTINMIIKIEYEETLLAKKYKDYTSYKKKSFKLLPYLY